MSRLEIEIIPILNDNYVYLLRDSAAEDSAAEDTAVVDPGDAAPVLDRLQEKGWRLGWILATHHHPDHTAGIPELVKRTGCRVAGPAGERDAIPRIGLELAAGDRFALGQAQAEILETPGHTRGHISYWFEESKALFCADTLFSLGCGRLFEGTAEQMWSSLQKLAALPDDTLVYCGHEYTLSNARFALSIDPDNEALCERAAEVERLRAAEEPTIPSRLGTEKAANPFLRAGDTELRRRLGVADDASDAEVFGEIRRRKDAF